MASKGLNNKYEKQYFQPLKNSDGFFSDSLRATNKDKKVTARASKKKRKK